MRHYTTIVQFLRSSAFTRLLMIIRLHKYQYIGVAVCQMILTGLSIWFASNLQFLFNLGAYVSVDQFHRIVIVFCLVTALQWIFGFLNDWLRENLNETIFFRLRHHVYTHLQNLPARFHENTHTSVTHNVFYNELPITKNFLVFDILNFITLPLSFLIIGVYLFIVHPWLGLVAIAIGPMQLISNWIFKRKYLDAVAERNQASANVLFQVNETLHGIRDIKINQLEQANNTRFDQLCNEGIQAWNRYNKLNFLRILIKDIPENLGFIVGVALSISMMINGEVGPGSLVAFLSLLNKVSTPFNNIVTAVTNLQQSVSGAIKLFEIMDLLPEKLNEGRTVTRNIPSLTFDRLHFEYAEGLDTLRDISFTVPPGAMVAIVGPSGAGKSTIVKLLLRLYDPSSGTITWNGLPYSELSIASIREQIALVPQDVFLFDGTIRHNVAISRPDATEEDIIRACNLAQAYEFITALPGGLNAIIGERGIKLSQGQKQRIAIARAILKEAPLLVLDEPTSALDIETEEYFQQGLTDWASPCTKIVIAHRLTTIKQADYVIFLEHGAIAEAGTPKELIHSKGRFYNYWIKQQSVHSNL